MSENIMYKNIADKMKNDKEEIAMLKLEIERLNDVLIHKPDTKLSLKTEDGKQLFIIQSERIDMQEELNKANMQLMKELQDYKSRCENANGKVQLIRDLGFDYDGFNDVNNLKLLIDELVRIAGETKDILNGKSDE